MKLSLSWIKDFVNIPEDMDLKQLAYDLTMSTVEVEDVEDVFTSGEEPSDPDSGRTPDPSGTDP